MHSIGGFPLTSWLERQHMVSSSADLECSTTDTKEGGCTITVHADKPSETNGNNETDDNDLLKKRTEIEQVPMNNQK